MRRALLPELERVRRALEHWNREIVTTRVTVRRAKCRSALLPKRLVHFVAGWTGSVRPVATWFAGSRRLRVSTSTPTYSCSVRLVGETVRSGFRRSCDRAPCRRVVADHPLFDGRRQRSRDRAHLTGLVGTDPSCARTVGSPPPALLRPLTEYEAWLESW